MPSRSRRCGGHSRNEPDEVVKGRERDRRTIEGDGQGVGAPGQVLGVRSEGDSPGVARERGKHDVRARTNDTRASYIFRATARAM